MNLDQIEQASIGRLDLQISYRCTSAHDPTDPDPVVWYDGCSLGLAREAQKERRGSHCRTAITVTFHDAEGNPLDRHEGERRLGELP